MNYYDL
jgi:hypothetical protein